MDYVPGIGDVTVGTSMAITPALVEATAMRLNYALPESGSTLFAVRGASLDSGADGGRMLDSITVRRVRPNHVDFRCLIGVLDRSSRKVCLYAGSTVPEFAHVRANLRRIGGCNMSPPGLYRFHVGLHGRTKRFKQPGALLQAAPTVVLRTTRTGVYDVSDQDCFWDKGEFGNNLHSAIFTGNAPKFSSAGCQIVRGTYEREGWIPAGDFASFRLSAGLSARRSGAVDLTTPEDGRAFHYALFTFSELFGQANNAFGQRGLLRYGSSGQQVSALQQRIGARASGSFDAATMERWLAHQIEQGGQEYPIATV
ncbi:MAG: hypothetical protein WDM79_14950 [Terricaulis sp.]